MSLAGHEYVHTERQARFLSDFEQTGLNKPVSAEITVQKLTTTGTESLMQALCKHEGTGTDPAKLCNIDLLSFLLQELVQMMEAAVRIAQKREKHSFLTLLYTL